MVSYVDTGAIVADVPMESSQLKDAVLEGPVRVGRYEVTALIGQGGMGDVYDAVDIEHGSRVALKTLRDCEVAPDRLLLFKNEFRAVTDLAHPNLVPLYELSYHDGLWFFTMERVEGVGLLQGARSTTNGVSATRARTAPTGSFPTVAAGPRAISQEPETEPEPIPMGDLVCDLAFFTNAVAQVLDALEYLHGRGIVHQDLKPSNILIDEAGMARVLDFGLAQRIGESLRLNQGKTAGTRSYMAPELLGGSSATPESDLYALGCTMFQLLSGHLPVDTGTVPRRPRRVERVVAGVPPAIAEICHRLLAQAPGDRPTINEVRDALGVAYSSAGGEASAAFVGREEQLGRLMEVLDAIRSGTNVIARIEGGSGVGKSALVRNFTEWLGADVLFLRGRCYERESVPYKAFDGIIDALAVKLATYDDATWESLRPPWFDELQLVFPVLRRGTAPDAETISAHELRRRVLDGLVALFTRLAARQPLVLEIDDLQWADDDSITLLRKLLDDAPPRLMLCLPLRPDDAVQNDVVAAFLEDVERLPPERTLRIPLGPLERQEAAALARRLLSALSLPTRLAPRIAEESGGVPFLLEELVHSVAQRGADDASALRLDHAVAERARALPDAERTLVELLAVANNPIPRDVACRAAGLDGNELSVLAALHRGHFVHSAGVRAEDRLGIYHDRMRESVLAYLGPERTADLHASLGRVLSASLDPEAPGSQLYDAVRHLAVAGEKLSADERLEAARLHLVAAQQARSAAAFPLAYRCFEDGIALLPADAWESHYETSLALHVGAAEGAYLTSEWEAMERRIEDVKTKSRELIDQIPAWVVQVDALAGSGHYDGAIDVGLEALRLLGVSLPRNPSAADVEAMVGKALGELGRVGPEGLESMPDAEDPGVLAVMRIQVRLCPVAFFVQPQLLALMSANLVVTSVEQGLSTATPNALALFGLIMNTAGLHPASHEWGELAVRLLDRWDDRSLEAATRHVAFNFVLPWTVPLRTILASSREVFEIGKRTGDFEYGAYSASMYVYMSIAAGEPLGALRDDAMDLGREMRAIGGLNGTHIHEPFEQLLVGLTGQSETPACLDGPHFNEAEALALAETMGAGSSACVHRTAMGVARYLCGDPKEASESLEIARQYLPFAPSCWLRVFCHQFAVLAGCASWPRLSEDERMALRPKLEESADELRSLATHSPFNFVHRVDLIEGALKHVDGDRDGARKKLQDALQRAVEHDWLCEVALTHELLAAVDEGAAQHQEAAREAFIAWGAHAARSAQDS